MCKTKPMLVCISYTITREEKCIHKGTCCQINFFLFVQNFNVCEKLDFVSFVFLSNKTLFSHMITPVTEVLASYRTIAKSSTAALVRDGPIGHNDSHPHLVA